MPEPKVNPNPRAIVDPPAILRHVMRRMFNKAVNPDKLAARRAKSEARRQKSGARHVVEYFHQLDDPYSHLAAQALVHLSSNYDVELVPHFIRATGGKTQPEREKLALWARRDAEMVAPYLGVSFPSQARTVPDRDHARIAARRLTGLSGTGLAQELPVVSTAIWRGDAPEGAQLCSDAEAEDCLNTGNARLRKLGHYSGAMFYYGGEWYWGLDRLFHLERRLRALGACRDVSVPLFAPRPQIDVGGVNAAGLELDFYPSLNSPYTSIIYDRTLAMVRDCGIQLHHKPVLPMIMRGLPITRAKGMYIMFDARREGEDLGLSFGPVMTPIGDPVRKIYSLLPWAKGQGRDTELLSSALRLAFIEGVGLHRTSGLAKAVEDAGLDWEQAQAHLGSDNWQNAVSRAQGELDSQLGFWGVPCFRLRGGDGFEDFSVWGQDRLWLIAAEIRKRAKVTEQ
ncbi:DSBA-like thioredoxin domain protein [Falsiruegeria litorea R37]|uniref:DSBA-like thioredoxin domain protein n=1 Tax=Falsiruegeria litorea R37 TaxID=1200284 RepID=A0A1Y5SR25_9RHOB|nr:DsbA family protein [Falsiruegeria litorea]SLN46325.1 DSBA-like thioredoxin domain protein [Falsiruegeria litorea R37]